MQINKNCQPKPIAFNALYKFILLPKELERTIEEKIMNDPKTRTWLVERIYSFEKKTTKGKDLKADRFKACIAMPRRELILGFTGDEFISFNKISTEIKEKAEATQEPISDIFTLINRAYLEFLAKTGKTLEDFIEVNINATIQKISAGPSLN
jgi:hypothetical protein